MRSSVSLLILLATAHAAFLYGDIHASDSHTLNQTMIRIEGDFTYQLVTDKQNYSIFLPDGNYSVRAEAFDQYGDVAYSDSESVRVGTEDQRLDLVLRPAMNTQLVVLAFTVFLLVAVFLWARGLRASKKEAYAPVERPIEDRPPLDDEAKKILSYLDSVEGRANQKEMKEALGFSDAKLSLILTELEHEGRVKRFKRGRGNVVRKL